MYPTPGQPLGLRLPDPRDAARDAYRSLSPAKQELLSFWAEHALVHAALHQGRSSDESADCVANTAELAALASAECISEVANLEVKGALLAAGTYPTLDTRWNTGAWDVEIIYAGVPLRKGPIFSTS